MDILSHALSGVLATTGVAAYSKKRLWQMAVIVFCGAIGAVLPDIDTITLWSKFDTTIGEIMELPFTGRTIYFGNFSYSHHNMTHSLAAGLMATVLTGIVIYFSDVARSKGQTTVTFLKTKAGYLIALFTGYTMHLFGDLPTPGHAWQGIKLLWPFSYPMGGTGHIWWWNNYDIFLLLFMGCLANLGLILLCQYLKKPILRHTAAILTAMVFATAVYQITHRPVRFASTGNATHAANERHSLEVQRILLGEPLFEIMVSLDRRLKIYF